MQLLGCFHACWVKTLQVWSIRKRSTHIPKVTLTLCPGKSPKFISSVPQDKIWGFYLSLLFDVQDNAWLFLHLPLGRDFKNIWMWSFCYVAFAVGLLSDNWFLSYAIFHLGSLFILLHCQACKENNAHGYIQHPSACAFIGRLSVFPRFWAQLRKQDHRNISHEGQAIWTWKYLIPSRFI